MVELLDLREFLLDVDSFVGDEVFDLVQLDLGSGHVLVEVHLLYRPLDVLNRVHVYVVNQLSFLEDGGLGFLSFDLEQGPAVGLVVPELALVL